MQQEREAEIKIWEEQKGAKHKNQVDEYYRGTRRRRKGTKSPPRRTNLRCAT